MKAVQFSYGIVGLCTRISSGFYVIGRRKQSCINNCNYSRGYEHLTVKEVDPELCVKTDKRRSAPYSCASSVTETGQSDSIYLARKTRGYAISLRHTGMRSLASLSASFTFACQICAIENAHAVAADPAVLPGIDWTPLATSTLAGLSTCLGASAAFLIQPDERQLPNSFDDVLCFSLALAASVMVTVSLVSLLPESFAAQSLSDMQLNVWFGTRIASFLGGCLVSWGISRVISEPDVDSFVKNLNNMDEGRSGWDTQGDVPLSSLSASDLVSYKLVATDLGDALPDMSNYEETVTGQIHAWRMTMLLFVSLALHNVPEGFAVAVSSLHSTRLGISTAVAIACHNMPEGVAISVPCLVANPRNPWLAFGLASLSGFAEPLGALVAVLWFRNGFSSDALEAVLAFVAGVMITVAIGELIPDAVRYASRDRESPLESWPLKGGLVIGTMLMLGTESILQ